MIRMKKDAMPLLLSAGFSIACLCGPIVAADGDLDPSFGEGDGLVTIAFDLGGAPLANWDAATALALQDDGKILVGGHVNTDSGAFDWGVVRLEANGTLDTSFGIGGLVSLSWNDGGSLNDRLRALAVQTDGRIVLVGEADNAQGGVAAAARLTASGQLDTSFGVGGRFRHPVLSRAKDVAIQPDGKLVVVGLEVSSGQPFLVLRLTGNGALDSTFDSDGVVTIFPNPCCAAEARAVALQADGKIVVAGWSNQFAVARLLPNGAIDPTFDHDGVAEIVFGGAGVEVPSAVAVQDDGRIVVAGTVPPESFGVARLLADGSLDTSFSGGKRTISLGPTGSSFDQARDMAIQADGRIVVVGRHIESGAVEFAVVRLTPAGLLDSTFGSGGSTLFTFDGRPSEAHAISIQPDGRILVAGEADYQRPDLDFGVARLVSQGSTGSGSCISSGTRLCLHQGRFAIEIEWTNFSGVTRHALVASFQTDGSGLFYYIDPTNLEFLIKVIDACSYSGTYWVFFAGTTNVGFTVEVTDTLMQQTVVYSNPLGHAADAVTDTLALFTCP